MLAGSLQAVTTIEMVFPDQTDHYGPLFGGHVLRLMDKAAFVAASCYARRALVIASSERRLCADGRFIMVTQDKEGISTTVEPLTT